MAYKRKVKLICVCALLALTLGFIWINSLIPPATSLEESGNAYNSVIAAIKSLFGEQFGSRFEQVITLYVVRKTIHATEFATLGIELFLLYNVIGRYSYGKIFELVSLGLLAAVIDESLQLLSGRTSSTADVLLDTCGFVIATGIAVLIKFLVDRRKTKN